MNWIVTEELDCENSLDRLGLLAISHRTDRRSRFKQDKHFKNIFFKWTIPLLLNFKYNKQKLKKNNN